MTQTGVIVGTPAYMSPEQLTGGKASTASDIYALSLLAYEMVAGKKLFTLETAMEHAIARIQEPPLREPLSKPWKRAIESALARDPAGRPQSAAEFVAALEGARTTAAFKPARPARPVWIRWAPAAGVALLLAIAAWTFRGSDSPPGDDNLLLARSLLAHDYRPGNIDKAIPLLEDAVQKNPRLATAHSLLGSAYKYKSASTGNAAQKAKAREHAQRAIELDPEIYNPHVLMATLHSEMNQPDSASTEFRKALSLAPRQWDARVDYGLHLADAGRREEAEKELRLAADLAPEEWRARFALGNFLAQNGRDSEAQTAYQDAIRLTPDNPEVFNNLGTLHRREGRYREAREAFQKSLQLAERTRTYTNLAAVLRLEGESEKAIEILKKAAATSDATHATWATLASAYWNTPGRREQAREPYLKSIEMAEEERKRQPQGARFLATLASRYAAVGKFEECRRLIRQAAAMDPNDREVMIRAAEAAELMNERTEAIRWLAAAVQLGYPVETVRRNADLAPLLSDPRYPKQTGKKGETQ